MQFYIEQAGLWLKPNTASQLKPDMPQADISSNSSTCVRLSIINHAYELPHRVPVWSVFILITSGQ